MPTLTVNTQVSPRIVTVAAPDVTISVQEVLDLLREWEDSPAQMDDPQIISAAGKEELGGGEAVGITATLLDAQLEFEARTDVLSSGTVSTQDVTGQTLTAIGATFQTDGVARGDLVINLTDGSQATVVSVTSETELLTTTLVGGVDNQYDISDSIDIYDVVQCEVSGGNLVAQNAAGSTISTIFPSFGTQVILAKASQGTLTNTLGSGDVETAVVSALTTNTEAELSGVPAASPDLHAMVQFIYMWIRNEVTQNGTTTTMKTDAGTTLGTSATSESGGTVTKGKMS